MKIKSIITIVLIVFVCASVVYLVAKENGKPEPVQDETAIAQTSQEPVNETAQVDPGTGVEQPVDAPADDSMPPDQVASNPDEPVSSEPVADPPEKVKETPKNTDTSSAPNTGKAEEKTPAAKPSEPEKKTETGKTETSSTPPVEQPKAPAQEKPKEEPVAPRQTSSQEAPKKEETKKADDEKIIVYYFRTTKRCPSCLRIEEYTEKAIISGFSWERGTGKLLYKVINTDEPKYSHFVKDYKLTTKSVVLVRMVNGKQTEWKNLDRVWELNQRKEAFIKYIKEEVRNFMEKK